MAAVSRAEGPLSYPALPGAWLQCDMGGSDNFLDGRPGTRLSQGVLIRV